MVKWTPKSENDLDQIREHIAKNFNVDLAIITVNEIIDYVETLLSSKPLAGSVFEANPLFSRIIFEGNSIFYCENPRDQNLYVVYVQPRGTRFKQGRLDNKSIA
jgi:plasmid stabilization system protein ParE